MSTVNPTLPTTSFIGNGDFNWWLGTVKNNDDSESKLGRVKVCILGYHRPEESPENLPWAMVMQPTDNPASNGAGGGPVSLKVGSFVVGFFLDFPDCQQPVVIGTLLGKIRAVEEKDSAKAKDYPASYENSIGAKGTDATDVGVSAAALGNDGGAKNNAASKHDARAMAQASTANPSGTVSKTPVADGKNGGDKTLSDTISEAISEIMTVLSQSRKVPKGLSTTLTANIDSEEQVIPVTSTAKFPPTGIIQIGSEKIGYNNISDKKFLLAKRGMDGTGIKRPVGGQGGRKSRYSQGVNRDNVTHKKGAKVTIITKGEYLGGSSKEGDLMGTFSDTLIDMKGLVDDQLEKIRNALYWLVNQIKSFLMESVTKILNAIGLSAVSPIPMFGKTLTDAINFILKEIVCILDTSLIEALFSGIESAINSVVNSALSALDNVQCIFDSIFNSIFQLVDISNDIFSMVNGIGGTLSGAGGGGVGGVSQISDMSSLNISSALEFIFQLLGIGCNKKTRDPFALTFESCPIASLLECPDGNPYGVQLGGLPGKSNPVYSKVTGSFSETGSMVMFDDTPYSTRMVVEHGPSGSGIVIYDNGDMRITTAGKQTELVVKDQEIIVKGNVKMNVDGNYHLKVGKDYHLEVGGHYNVAVNQESKITYAGEHETLMKNDGKIEATNALALVASKLGFTASGQTETFSPTITTWTTEQNHFALGSYNITCTYKNDFIAQDKLRVIANKNVAARLGTNFEYGLGTSNRVQTKIEEESWLSGHIQNVFGINTENMLSSDQKTTIGTTMFSKLATSIEDVTGAKITSTTGLEGVISNALKFDLSSSINVKKGAIITNN